MKLTSALLIFLIAFIGSLEGSYPEQQPNDESREESSGDHLQNENTSGERENSQFSNPQRPEDSSVPAPSPVTTKDDGEEFVPPKRPKESENKASQRRGKRSPNGESKGSKQRPRNNNHNTTTSSSSSGRYHSEDDTLVKKSHTESNRDRPGSSKHSDHDYDQRGEGQPGQSEEEKQAREEELRQQRIREEHIKREKERQKAGTQIAKATLRAATDERCDWRARPISFLKVQNEHSQTYGYCYCIGSSLRIIFILAQGEVCGSYYKVIYFYNLILFVLSVR